MSLSSVSFSSPHFQFISALKKMINRRESRLRTRISKSLQIPQLQRLWHDPASNPLRRLIYRRNRTLFFHTTYSINADHRYDVQLENTGSKIFNLDYLDESTIVSAANEYGSDVPLDILINCGGIGMAPEKWTDTTAEQMVYKYRVMTVVCPSLLFLNILNIKGSR